VNLMRVVRLHEAARPCLRLLFHVPNGGERHVRVAQKLKAEGQKPGVPDYFLPVARHGFHGLAIELKSLTGCASREQKCWIEALRAEGWRVEVCRGWEQAWRVLEEYTA
jgi:hypothetical protein